MTLALPRMPEPYAWHTELVGPCLVGIVLRSGPLPVAEEHVDIGRCNSMDEMAATVRTKAYDLWNDYTAAINRTKWAQELFG